MKIYKKKNGITEQQVFLNGGRQCYAKAVEKEAMLSWLASFRCYRYQYMVGIHCSMSGNVVCMCVCVWMGWGVKQVQDTMPCRSHNTNYKKKNEC